MGRQAGEWLRQGRVREEGAGAERNKLCWHGARLASGKRPGRKGRGVLAGRTTGALLQKGHDG